MKLLNQIIMFATCYYFLLVYKYEILTLFIISSSEETRLLLNLSESSCHLCT